MKSLVFAFVALVCLFPGKVSGQGQLYSKIHINLQHSDENGQTFSETRNNNSWIGIKGDYSLGDGVDVVYRFEWKVNVTDESGEHLFTERPQYLGIRGKYGELLLGRNFTALWAAQGKMDLFNHTEGDIKNLFKGENRLPDVVTFISPSYRNIKFETTLIKGTGNKGESALSAGVYYGDKYLKKNDLFVALAQDFDVKGYDVSRVSAQYRFSVNKVGLMIQRQVLKNSGESEFGMMANYQYDTGRFAWKTQAQYMEDNKGLQIGVDFKLAENTKIFAFVSNYNEEDKDDRRYLGLGIEHSMSLPF